MKVLVLASQKNFLNLLAEMAWCYSSQVSMNQEVVFLEIEKSQGLYSPQEIAENIQNECQKLNIPLQLSLGKSPAEAWAFLYYKLRSKEKLPLQALAFYLDPFQTKKELKLVPLMIETFQHLGFQSFADLEQLPRLGVASRFGAEALWALQQVDQDQQQSWPPWQPPEVIVESQLFDPDQRVQSCEALQFVLKPLVERIVQRLLWRHEGLCQIELSLHLEKFSVVTEPLRQWSISFSFQQTQAKEILQVLLEKLNFDLQMKPLESSVVFVGLKVLEKSPLADRQKDFFSKKEEDLEKEASLVSRLQQKVGPDHIFKVALQESHRPEATWVSKENTTKDFKFPLHLARRPLVLFKRPRPLRKWGSDLIYQNRRYKILDWQGPEKIVSEWWISNLTRQYWVVHIEQSPSWWIFSDLSKACTENLYLHGIFD